MQGRFLFFRNLLGGEVLENLTPVLAAASTVTPAERTVSDFFAGALAGIADRPFDGASGRVAGDLAGGIPLHLFSASVAVVAGVIHLLRAFALGTGGARHAGERRVHEHHFRAVDYEVRREPIVVVRLAEMVNGRAHGPLVVVGIRDHGHEFGTAKGGSKRDDEAVGHLLAGVEDPRRKRSLAHRHHHVRQHHLKLEGEHGLGLRFAVGPFVSPPLLFLFEVRFRREPRLGEKARHVLLVDLLLHELHRLVERPDDGKRVPGKGRLGGLAMQLLVLDDQDTHFFSCYFSALAKA